MVNEFVTSVIPFSHPWTPPIRAGFTRQRSARSPIMQHPSIRVVTALLLLSVFTVAAADTLFVPGHYPTIQQAVGRGAMGRQDPGPPRHLRREPHRGQRCGPKKPEGSRKHDHRRRDEKRGGLLLHSRYERRGPRGLHAHQRVGLLRLGRRRVLLAGLARHPEQHHHQELGHLLRRGYRLRVRGQAPDREQPHHGESRRVRRRRGRAPTPARPR